MPMALSFSQSVSLSHSFQHHLQLPFAPQLQSIPLSKANIEFLQFPSIRCSSSFDDKNRITLRTCKNCKTQFDPALNHPRACRFHTAHFGGETKRKFESVYKGGTMDTPDSGKVFQYWHCCGSEDPFDPDMESHTICGSLVCGMCNTVNKTEDSKYLSETHTGRFDGWIGWASTMTFCVK